MYGMVEHDFDDDGNELAEQLGAIAYLIPVDLTFSMWRPRVAMGCVARKAWRARCSRLRWYSPQFLNRYHPTLSRHDYHPRLPGVASAATEDLADSIDVETSADDGDLAVDGRAVSAACDSR